MKPAQILLVEDSPGDARLTIEALENGHIHNKITHVQDGVEAIEFLRSNDEKPSLVLLDLNMPRMDGYGVLKSMRQDQRLKNIPVIALTTSDSELDIRKCYEAGANAFVTKPVELDEFMAAVKKLGEFWFQIVSLPT